MVDNLIRLFDSEEKTFDTNGIGVLLDAESCLVTEERNGIFELEMVYPIDGQHYADISLRRIIVVKSNPDSDPQPFRIYEISKPINGLVTINAEHISYDLSGYPVSPFKVEGSVDDILSKFKEMCPIDCPFEFWTNKNLELKKEFNVSVPCSIRSLLCGSEGSLTDIYGSGEFEFDKFLVRFWLNRGENSGVTIRYGKNLTDVKQEENCESVYTGVYPYWYSETDNILVTLPEGEKIVYAETEYPFTRILPLDLSDKFANKPSQDQLREAAESYITDNDITVPKVSIDVSFQQLFKTTEYADIAALESVHLCDTVTVEFPKLGVSATAKCIKTVYDALLDKYDKVELGDAKSNLANTLSQQSKVVESSTSKSYVDKAIDAATKMVTGNSGGYVVVHSSTGGRIPDELLIMDADNIETAVNVWRWNMAGLGFSSEGYHGRYGTAITQDGSIVANFITTGTLKAIDIEACTFKSEEVEVDGEKRSLFSVSKDGVLYAAAGEIGGCKIQNGELEVPSAHITGKLVADQIDVQDLEIKGRFVLSGVDYGDLENEDESGFLLESDGLLKANNAIISGTIYAGAGQIAGLIVEKQEETVSGVLIHSRVFRSQDSSTDPVFEIRVVDEDKTSSVKITNLSGQTAVFSNDLSVRQRLSVGSELSVGFLRFSGSLMYLNNELLINFDYQPTASLVTATLENNWASITITVRTSKDLSASKTFYFKTHTTWGGWSETRSITIPAGRHEASQSFSGPFWGYDDAYFVDSGTKSYSFYETITGYIDFRKHIEPWISGTYDLGSRAYRWNNGWIDNLTIKGGTIGEEGEKITSDREKKKDILAISGSYDALFDKLRPVSFRYKKNTSNRIHTGFIAQDVEDAMRESGVSTTDFAAYCEEKEDGKIVRSLRYTEFIALNTYEIQCLKARVAELEKLLRG